jgi:hypothetical protein
VNAVALLAAAASWSAPQTVSAPHTFAGPLLAGDSARGALAAWGWQDGIGQKAASGAGFVTVDGRGAVSAERRAPAGLVAAQPYDGGAVLLASRQIDKRGQRWRLTVKDGTRTIRLATAFILFRPQLSVAPDGSAIVAWVEFHHHRQIVRASTRRGGGRFSRPFTLSGRGQTTVLADAAAGGGRFLAAFVRNGRLLARVHTARGWSALHRLQRAHGKSHWQLTASRDGRHGGLDLVWIRHRFTQPGRPGARELFAAGYGGRWNAPQRLEADDAVGVQLAFAPALTLTYAFGPNSAGVARTRFLPGTGRFGAPLEAAPAQGGLRSVSAASVPGQGLVVGWIIPNPAGDGGGIGYAATMGPGENSFRPREQVTPNEATFDMRLVRTAAGVRAFWTARPDGTGPGIPLDQIRTVVRTALRLPPGS